MNSSASFPKLMFCSPKHENCTTDLCKLWGRLLYPFETMPLVGKTLRNSHMTSDSVAKLHRSSELQTIFQVGVMDVGLKYET